MAKKCSECKGKGMVYCDCMGDDGKSSDGDGCSSCGGKGEYECPICGGGGWISERDVS